jgi:hypothetical protein
MTDRETIFAYRMKQTEETLSEAIRMLEAGFSPRSIVNRSYYAMFYAVLALFTYTQDLPGFKYPLKVIVQKEGNTCTVITAYPLKRREMKHEGVL